MRPSSRGTPAATRAPKAIKRMSSVIGSEVTSAVLKSLLIDVAHLVVGARVAELADRQLRVGGLRGGDGPQRRVGALLGRCLVAGDLEAGQGGVAVRRDLRAVGGRRRGSRSRRRRAAGRGGTGRRPPRRGSGGCSRSAVALCTSTISSALFGKAASTVRSARPDSPTPRWALSSVFVPTAPPTMKATITNASQPQIAVLRCSALQRPMRAATLRRSRSGRLARRSCGLASLGRSPTTSGIDGRPPPGPACRCRPGNSAPG